MKVAVVLRQVTGTDKVAVANVTILEESRRPDSYAKEILHRVEREFAIQFPDLAQVCTFSVYIAEVDEDI